MEALCHQDMVYCVYLRLCRRLGLFMSYFCDLFFFCFFCYHFHFHCNLSYNIIDIEKLVYWTCLSKVQSQGVAELLLNFLPIST